MALVGEETDFNVGFELLNNHTDMHLSQYSYWAIQGFYRSRHLPFQTSIRPYYDKDEYCWRCMESNDVFMCRVDRIEQGGE
jgi:hypothetical protein